MNKIIITVSDLLKEVSIRNNIIKDTTSRMIAASENGSMDNVKAYSELLDVATKELKELLNQKYVIFEGTANTM